MVNNRWLAGYYIVIGYGLLIAFLLSSRLIAEFPWYHTYRTGYTAAFLLMPLSFFYIRSLIKQEKFKRVDLLHFLPAIMFTIDFIPFYFRSADYKLQQLTIDAQGLNTIWNQFSQGWLGIGFIYVPLRIALTVVYWIWQVRMIIHSSKVKGGQNLLGENKTVLLWVKVLCASQFLFFVPYYVNSFFGSQQNFFFVIHTLLAISVSITIVVLVLQPTILYGLKGIMVRNFKDDPENNDKVYKGKETVTITKELKKEIATVATETIEDNVNGEIYLSGQKLTTLGKQVSEHILSKQFYLKKGSTSAALAAEMNMQPYLLSAVINQVFKTNFNDFLNGYRVDHAKKLIQNGDAKLLTLEALSEQSGFNNRNSFTIAFKKHTGQTPSDFIKQSYSTVN